MALEKGDRYQKGLEKQFELRGDQDNSSIEELGDLGNYIIEFVMGDIYGRPNLSMRDRRIVALSMLAVTKSMQQLKSHLGFALNAGFTPEELEEIMIMATVYGGCPAGWGAVATLHEVLKERQE